ncbi:hypothetical protein Noda2021_04300 [Candidatus Dependentiae bacterium Noda2021]|nr:hypothetical protein Noda2021_04300 [Candidatus Dependentiae bacterium Noda2021]
MSWIFCITSFAQERIISFESAITVHSNSSMSVVETITVAARGEQIKRGIIRAIPTKYDRPHVGTYTVGFIITSVLHNDVPAPFVVESSAYGKEIYIGDKNILLQPGVHTYQIAYTTDRQLLFLPEHDELYWNVTGNFWRLPIDRARAIITLPTQVPMNQVEVVAYTGFKGERAQDYTVDKTGRTIVVTTTTPLKSTYNYGSQGLTIAVAWPKGYVKEPSLFKQISYFVRDFQYQLWIGFIGLLLLCFIIWAWLTINREQKPGIIIPLFHPPTGMTPGGVNYIAQQQFELNAFSSEIVEMAVKGYLKIEYSNTSWMSGGHYILHKLTPPSDDAPQIQKDIYNQLFTGQDAVYLTESSQNITEPALRRLGTTLDLRYGPYLKFYSTYASIAWALAIGGIIFGIIFFSSNNHTHWDLLVAASIFIATFLFSRRCYGFTPEGKKLSEDIQGFKLFLTTTEQERMKMIGTPPTRTPELYEKYLPYAMALGVEQQWTKQFTPVFERLKQEGHAYVPFWYMGPQGSSFASFRPAAFNSSVNSSFASSLRSTTTFTTGTGGGGSSGGGRGGGGGGGW